MPLDGEPISPLLLPKGWALSERVQDVVRIEGLAIRRAGLCATSDGRQAVGSAADLEDDPLPRAAFELMERIALLEAAGVPDALFPVRSREGDEVGTIRSWHAFPSGDAPEVWTFARSSGVSLHATWAAACDAAACELVERDRVLRAWAGEIRPARAEDNPISSTLSAAMPSYDWHTYLFPAPGAGSIGRDVEVAGVFGFPKPSSAPLVLGFGARSNRYDALRAAQREVLQSLAFLWGEPIPERVPDPLPTPMTHLETYQVRDRQKTLRRWLEKGHATHFRPWPPTVDHDLRFADVTPSWLEGRLRVVRAMSSAAIPMPLGLSPLFAHLPPELRIHPIP